MSTEAASSGDQGSSVSGLQRFDRFISTVPFYAILLAAYPVLRLYSDNVADVDGTAVLVPLLLVVALATAGLVLLTMAWGDPRRAAIVVAAIVLPFLSFGLIAEAVQPAWPHEPMVRAYLVALMIWVAVIFLGVYAALKLSARLTTVTQALNVLAITLVLLTLLPIGSFAVSSGAGGGASPAPAAKVLDPVAGTPGDLAKRDIYHFVLDRYGSANALRVGLGIDNTAFEEWLGERGFDVAGDAYANYERTALSLSSTHSMSLHDGLAERMGSSGQDLGPLYELIGNSAAAQILQGLGYRYYHVGSWFHPTARSDIADHVEEPAFQISFASTLTDQSAITGLREIATMVTTLSAHGTPERQAEVTATQFERLAQISQEPGPKYVFAHLLVPHDPYLFLADGTFDPQNASFSSQLEYANMKLRETLEPLLALPEDERPIIILQADEGPYPSRYADDRDHFDWNTATVDELTAKFGVLNAMYLPGPEGERPIPDDMTLVNTFPEVFGRYFDIDIPRLPDRVFALGGRGPYDFLEVTDMLAGPVPDPSGSLEG